MNGERYVIHDYGTPRPGLDEDDVPDIDGFGLWCRVDDEHEVPVYSRHDTGVWYSLWQSNSSFMVRPLDPRFYSLVRTLVATPEQDVFLDEIEALPEPERELITSLTAMVESDAVPPELAELIHYCIEHDAENGGDSGDAP